ncbi:NAD-dependent epimerase/dehydratase family protein [Rhodococcus sp. NPDC058521]|uniref:NAD-dependent epimerase/dehydratase family protein n=1 Tax=Rhodococcus sp. NPDC058521 TaxID=3346536 RepID=UPI0036469AFB
MSVPTWVVGSGGLLGGALTAELRRRGVNPLISKVLWHDNSLARAVLIEDARRLVADSAGGPWQVIWCAGAGVNGTTVEEFATENALLGAVLDELAAAGESGTVFHASSAGGVYAGVPAPPHTENSPVAPLGDYGRAKLAAEQLVTDFALRHEARAVIGRLANLYGPGQNLAKPQGLISHLCRGYLLASPVSIYVPMDTLRDYLYVTDAAEMVADTLDHARHAPTGAVTKIYGSGQSVTIGSILGACRTVFRRKPNVVLASSPLAAVQAKDLRLHSVVWPEIDERTHRPLPAGISSTLESIRHHVTVTH